MAKVPSKLQTSVPKVIADLYASRPGDELDWVPAGDVIRVIPQKPRTHQERRSVEERLKLFREMVERQRKREATLGQSEAPAQEAWKQHEVERGWRREDLYTRGQPR